MAADSKTASATGQQELAAAPAAEGLRHLLELRREQLGEQYHCFLEQAGEESLHDFRVALRRLRSLLRNYRGVIESKALLGERLRQIQRLTNQSRDLEVMITQLCHSGAEQLPLTLALQQQLEDAYRQLHQQLPPLWYSLTPLLEGELIAPANIPGHTTLGQLSSTVGHRQLARLMEELHTLHDQFDEQLLHHLRIRGKRLRYLLEPLAIDAKTTGAVEALKQFQDELGDYRDLQLLLRRLETVPVEYNDSETRACYLSQRELLQKRRSEAIKYRKHHTQQRLQHVIEAALNQLRH